MFFQPPQYQFGLICKMINGDTAAFADPGLGKTVMVYSAFNILRKITSIKKLLVIAPLRPCYSVWPAERDKWDFCKNLTINIMHGKDKHIDVDADVNIINPEGLKWLVGTLVREYKDKEFPFDMLAVDESTKFKNSSSKRFKLLKIISPLFKRRVVLTGTPVPNGYDDLWSQFFIIDNGATFGKYKNQFHADYFYRGGFMGHQWIIQSQQASDEMFKKAAPICTVIKCEDHLSMPELIINDIVVKLPENAKHTYDTMEVALFAELENGNFNAASTQSVAAMKCHQIANGALYDDENKEEWVNGKPSRKGPRKFSVIHTAKLDALKDLFAELNGKQLLIAYNFKHDLAQMKAMYQKEFGLDLPHIGAGVSPEETNRLIDQWNSGDLPVLAGHPMSMGHGLNMQNGGHDICWYSMTWSSELFDQFNARVWRQGVKGDYVRIHRLIASSTIDRALNRAVAKKKGMQKNLEDFVQAFEKDEVKRSVIHESLLEYKNDIDS